MSNKNLIIAFGGSSPEHEVSVLSAMQVFAAMEKSAYQLVPLYITKSGKWLSGNSLKDLSNFKDLKSLESSAYPVSFTKDSMGTTHLTEQNKPSLLKNRPLFLFIPLFVHFMVAKGKMVLSKEYVNNLISLIQALECSHRRWVWIK